ncbi:MAG TPA: hypothetical protein VEK07_01695 [Polyangiaceae bacterium]|nr:hypothetical protein [Polyangiaceae bacterium]
MKRRSKRAGHTTKRQTQESQESGVFVVPSHGRLARRGSTHVVEEGSDETEASGRQRDRDGQAA